jgi:predicted AAA+ superfamily ATPase
LVDLKKQVAAGGLVHLCGPRQSGRTTLLHRLAGELEASWPGEVLLLRMDLDPVREAGLEAAVGAALREPRIVLVDEVHRLEGWDKAAARLRSRGLRLVLAGQHSPPEGAVRVDLTPLSFREVLEVRHPEMVRGLPEPMTMTHLVGPPAEVRDHLWAIHRQRRHLWEKHLRQFTRRGGYPRAALRDSDAWADHLLADVIDRSLGIDVPARAPIEQPALLRRILLEVARRTGTEISQGELARELDAAQPVVGRYLHCLEEVGLTREFRRFPPAPDARVPAKITLCDPGLRGAWLRDEPDIFASPADAAGPLCETVVQTALRGPGAKVHFWKDYRKPGDRRSPIESVSFVVLAPDGATAPVQVDFRRDESAEGERAIRSFLSRFDRPLGILVTRDSFSAAPGDPVLRLPLAEFLLAF